MNEDRVVDFQTVSHMEKKLEALKAQKIAIDHEMTDLEARIKQMTPMKDQYTGAATTRQLSFARDLLANSKYTTAHFILNRWQCHCIINFLHLNTDNEEMVAGFHEAAYHFEETFEEFIKEIYYLRQAHNVAARQSLINTFGEKIFRDMKSQALEYTDLNYGLLTKDVMAEYDISADFTRQAGFY